MFMLSFFVPGVGSGADGCLGYLATWEPLKKPRCKRRFMFVRYKTQVCQEVRWCRDKQFADESFWQH